MMYDDLNPKISIEEKDDNLKSGNTIGTIGTIGTGGTSGPGTPGFSGSSGYFNTTTTEAPISFSNRDDRRKYGINADEETRIRLEALKIIWSNPRMTDTHSFESLNNLAEMLADDFIKRNYIF